MKAQKDTLPSPKQPMLEELEQKTVLSEQDREELLEELIVEEDHNVSEGENRQPKPDSVVKNLQEIKKETSESGEA